jgi:hypothetical protein
VTAAARALGLFCLGVLLVRCGKGGEPSAAKPKQDLGAQTANIASDTAVLRDAQDAVNQVIRAGTDCDAVKPAYAEAIRRLDEATAKLRTPAGRATLDALRTQAGSIAHSCE